MNIKSPSIAVFGELLWDYIKTTEPLSEIDRQLGGAPANVAFRLHEAGTPVSFITRIGDDENGRAALEKLTSAGLNTDLIQIDNTTSTGVVSVVKKPNGDADYTIHKHVAYDDITWTPEALEACNDASILYLGTLAQRTPHGENAADHFIDAVKESGGDVFLDLNLRKDCYVPATILHTMMKADYLKLNDDELKVIKRMFTIQGDTEVEQCRAIMLEFGIKTVFLTRGERGAVAVTENGQVVEHPGHKVDVEDTIGAGDAFSAIVLRGLLNSTDREADIESIMDRACRVAATVAMTKGGMTPIEDAPQQLMREVPVPSLEGWQSGATIAKDPGLPA